MGFFKKQTQYPSIKRQGIYADTGSLSTLDGAIKIGLNRENLETFSIGSWQSYRFENVAFKIEQGGKVRNYTEDNIDGLVFNNEPTNIDDGIFGFAYTTLPKKEYIMFNSQEFTNNNFLSSGSSFQYFFPNEVDNFNKTSYPLKVKFGIDFYDYGNVLNPNNVRKKEDQDVTLTELFAQDWAQDLIDDYAAGGAEFPSGVSELKTFADGGLTQTPYGDSTTNGMWYISGGRNKSSKRLSNKVVNINYFFDYNSEGYDGDGYTFGGGSRSWHTVARGHAQIVIEIPDGYNSGNSFEFTSDGSQIGIMDRVKFGAGSRQGQKDRTYRVVDLRGDSNGIKEIYLDKIFPGIGTWVEESVNAGVDLRYNSRANTNGASPDLPPFDSLYNRNFYEFGGYAYEQDTLSSYGFSFDGDDVDGDTRGKFLPINVDLNQLAQGNVGGNGTPNDKERGQWDMWSRGTQNWEDSDKPPLYMGLGNWFRFSGAGNDRYFKDYTNEDSFADKTVSIFDNDAPVTTITHYNTDTGDDVRPYWTNQVNQNGNESYVVDNQLGTIPKWPGRWKQNENINFWTDSEYNDYSVGNAWNFGDQLTLENQDIDFPLINTTRDLAGGFVEEVDGVTRTDAPVEAHGYDNTVAGVTRSGLRDRAKTDTVRLPKFKFTPSNSPTRMECEFYNDGNHRINSRGVFPNFNGQGFYRIVIKGVQIKKLSGTPNDARLRLDARPFTFQEDVQFIGDETNKSYRFTGDEVGTNFGNSFDVKSNPFEIDAAESSLSLSAFLRVKLSKLYSVTENAGFIVRFQGIEYQEINANGLQLATPADEETGIPPTASVYKYKVIQWGDEKTKLTDQDILNSFLFKMYKDQSLDLWDVKRYLDFYFDSEYIKSPKYVANLDEDGEDTGGENVEGFVNMEEHVYETPGVKTIKAIVFRTTQFEQEIFETKLVTTNIVVNDGLTNAQNFSIFGGTNFNFLPLSENKKEAFLGGLSSDSDYHKSLLNMRKDDDFVQEDYLAKNSISQYLKKYRDGEYGEFPGQIDLGTTRVFSKPKDIYNFITDDRLEIVDNDFKLDSVKLPINTLATNIFIDDEDLKIDFNPSEVEFLTIQNQVGTGDKGILVGDYKLKQEENARITKESLPDVPLLSNDPEKQAY